MKLESSDFNRLAKVTLVTLAAGASLSLRAAQLPSTSYEPYTFTHLAGPFNGPGYGDGTNSTARFDSPWGMAMDSSGNIYVADTYNDTIRKVTPTGVATTLAGMPGVFGSADGTGSAARFYQPSGVAVDSAGNVYVADTGNDTIRRITPAGVVTTLAGTAGVSGNTNGTGSAASFNAPFGVAVDSAGNLYVGDQGNNIIRAITPGGVVTTLAGSGIAGVVNGTGTAARFNAPAGVAVDSAGNVYVADSNNDTIRKITPAGVVTTLAGSAGQAGSANGTNNVARFNTPNGVAVDSSGNLYVADTFNDTIRKVTPAGAVTTLAGKARTFGFANGTNTVARFYEPYGIAVDSAGNVYVGDYFNYAIRKVSPAGAVTTLAGLPVAFGSVDATGSAARFDSPSGVAVDSAGTVYVADTLNQTIRKITPAGAVTTWAGLPATSGTNDGTGSAARFYDPYSVAVDSAGNVYVADFGNNTIRKITPGAVVTTLAGLPGTVGSADGTNSTARFNTPSGVTVDSAGNVYVADTGNHTIRKITPAGVVTTLAGLAGVFGNADGTNSTARFYTPYDVAADGAGNVYVADNGNQLIRKITPAGVVTTLAGSWGALGADDGIGSAARFEFPRGVAADSSGNVYVADYFNHTIRKITPAGAVTTLGGIAQAYGSDDGTGSAARFFFPNSVAVDTSGNVYVAEVDNCIIRKGVPASLPPALPSLSGTTANNQIVLAWPTNSGGFTLQSSPDLGPAANWTNFTGNLPVVGSQFVLTNPISGGAQFFRLKK